MGMVSDGRSTPMIADRHDPDRRGASIDPYHVPPRNDRVVIGIRDQLVD
jgi:hypothetical protein